MASHTAAIDELGNQVPDCMVNGIPFHRSLRGRILILFVSMLLLIIASVTTLIHSHTRWVIKNEIQEDLHRYATNLSTLLDRYLAAQTTILLARASQLDLSSGADQVLGLNNDLVEPILQEIVVSDPHYIAAHVVDPQGIVARSSEPNQVGKPIIEDSSMFSTGTAELVRPTVNSDTLFFNIPITDTTGNFSGLLVVEAEPTWLTRPLNSVRPVHENTSVFWGYPTNTSTNEQLFYLTQESEGFTPNSAIDVAMLKAIAGESGFSHIPRNEEGHRSLVFYRPVGIGKWGLVTYMDPWEVFAPTRQVLWVTILVAVLLALIAVVIGVHIIRRLLAPLGQLTEAVDKVKTGDYSIKFGQVKNNEIGKLIKGFTGMVDTIRTSQYQLEDTVRRRTAELEASKEQLSSLVSGLVQQTDLMEQDLRQAELIQRSLLPRQPPEVKTVSLSALYIPGQRVGGDLYDVFRIDEQHIGLVVADATGHGVSAAMLSVLFKNRLDLIETHDRIYEHTNELKPLSEVPQFRTHSAIPVFEKVNNELVSDVVGSSMFVSAVFGILNEDTRALTITNAGHPPVLLLRASGEVETIKSPGSALGLNPDVQFEERTVMLEEGDRVLMYTDGLFSVNDRKQVTIEAIVEGLRKRNGNGNILNELVNEFAVGRTTDDLDDITLLLIDVREGLNQFSNQFDRSLPEVVTVVQTGSNDSPEAQVEIATEDACIYLVFRGRITWVKGEAVMLRLREAIESNKGIVLDLSECEYLDSAMLGTLHETAHECSQRGLDLHLQGVPKPIHEEFVELGLIDVLGFVRIDKLPIPTNLIALSGTTQEMHATQEWLLRAHQVLASLNEANEEEFREVIKELREGIDSVERSRTAS
ncbi:MAG: SpoIIE family protein phosphatase [Gammaproteobacteria bacterium]|nr:SpoIIE family protein phosphatase [Gammaproteobacteria bacterium]MDE0251518.1 SpoIIE family protein phosphatase [Gammaproteobacteria bacterium]MDE0403472.1 SpoIIE family protein phosphatase [Gammaproteobacteria bacterium]